MYFNKSYLPLGYFPADYFLVEAEELAGAIRATLAGAGAVSPSDVAALANLLASLYGHSDVPSAHLLAGVAQGLTDFERFINSAASQIKEVVDVVKMPKGAHFVIDRSVRNSKLDLRLDVLASTVEGRWPGYSFSWSNLGDQPFNQDHFTLPVNYSVPTVVGRPGNKKQKRSFV